MSLRSAQFNLDVVGRIRTFGAVSGVLVLLSLISISTLGLNFGIDFAGGYEIQVKFPNALTEGKIRDALKNSGVGDARVQRFGAADANEYLILVREHGTLDDVQKAALKTSFESLAGGEKNLLNWAVAESGEHLMVGFAQETTEAQVRELLQKHAVQIKGITRGEREDRPEFSIEFVSIADSIEEALRTAFAIDSETEIVQRVEFVGPQVGAQLRNQGIMAVVYALLFILFYIAVRFDLYFSPGAVVALIHDVIITVGVFSVFQFEFNLPIVAALLALVGYSLNDTIVVYDRIRENGVRLRGRELRAMVNTSINQTLSRTLLTSSTTLLVVMALLVVGGGIIRDFSIALLVGVVVGTYSSIGVASPVYILLREHYSNKQQAPGNKTVVAA